MTHAASASRARRSRRIRRERPGFRFALPVICLAQAMLGLDMTIVNVALPAIHQDLAFTGDGLAWVVDAYALSYAGLLLAGGRAADVFGQRRTFVAGVTLFAAASLAGGLATTSAWLVAARLTQGIGAALTGPAALSLVATAFPARADGAARQKAMAAFAAAGGLGAASGQLIGGAITEWASWRWVLFVNVPVGALLIAGARLVPALPSLRRRSLDLGGAVLATAAMLSLVYGVLRAGEHGWGDWITLIAMAAAAVLLAGFAAAESRAAEPLVPPRLFASPARACAYITGFLLYFWMYSALFLLTQFMQDVHGWSPLRTGVYWVPTATAMIAGTAVARRAAGRVPPWALVAAGALGWLVASGWYAQLHAGSSYLTGLLPGFAISGAGLGLALAANLPLAVTGARPADMGIASGVLQASQQLGGSIGVAALAAIATAAASRAVKAAAHQHVTVPLAVLHASWAHGFVTALAFGVPVAAAAIAVQAVAWWRHTRPASHLEMGARVPGRAAAHAGETE
jgi:EmrB/QacA subfamily drug resistance transporter